MPTSALVVVLMILLVFQYMTMLNRRHRLLKGTAIEFMGYSLARADVAVWVLGIGIAGLSLGIAISDRYAPVDRWYASMLVAIMFGHCTCIWRFADEQARKNITRDPHRNPERQVSGDGA
jgi:hypothetical protein